MGTLLIFSVDDLLCAAKREIKNKHSSAPGIKASSRRWESWVPVPAPRTNHVSYSLNGSGRGCCVVLSSVFQSVLSVVSMCLQN